MVWALLAVVSVPLLLCLAGVALLTAQNRALRGRPGDLIVRRRRAGKKHWQRGHAIWVRDELAFRGSPAAWSKALIGVQSIVPLQPTEHETHRLRHLSAYPSLVRFIDRNGEHVDFATAPEQAIEIAGPLVLTAATTAPRTSSEV